MALRMDLLVGALLIIGATLVVPGCRTVFAGGGYSGGAVRAVGGEVDTPGSKTRAAESDAGVRDSGRAEGVGRRVAEAAEDLVGQRRIRIRGERFNADCTGTILAAHYAAGIDLRPFFSEYRGNGVRRLYSLGRDYRLIEKGTRTPKPGSVIFWDNTYDRNRDGKWNDPLTHAGIVVSVGRNNQIEYVHYDYSKGVALARMNLEREDTYTAERGGEKVLLNSPMRMKRDRHINPDAWLASHLHRSFGRLYRLVNGSA
jgi:hypothetical protein